MNSEEMAMLTWAFQHPWKYTIIEISHPMAIAFVIISIAKMFLGIGKKK